jgi:hypothetical protein
MVENFQNSSDFPIFGQKIDTNDVPLISKSFKIPKLEVISNIKELHKTGLLFIPTSIR